MMSPFKIDVNAGGFNLEVSGSYSKGKAEDKTGHPDSWTPAENDEIEITDVRTEDGKAIAGLDLREFREWWTGTVRDTLIERGYL